VLRDFLLLFFVDSTLGLGRKEKVMTNHKSMKRMLIFAAIFLMAGASFLVISTRGSRPLQNPASQKASNDDAIAVRQALRRGGLREAAKLKGIYVAEYNPHWDWGLFNVEALTKNSAAVIVGRFTKKLDARLLEGKVIFTDYEVAVEELVKGDIKQGQTIVVTLPGGRVFFEDGTSAEQITPTFEHPVPGRAYTLFLSQEAAVPSVFFLSGGPQGMFSIEDSAGVKSHGRPEDPAAVETKGTNRESFMKEVRELGRKWPKPGKCCG
jgi:hypothetical protein